MRSRRGSSGRLASSRGDDGNEWWAGDSSADDAGELGKFHGSGVEDVDIRTVARACQDAPQELNALLDRAQHT